MSVTSPAWEFFKKKDKSWKRSHSGKWVCVHQENYVGFFDTKTQALDAAEKKWPAASGVIGLFRVGEKPQRISISEFACAAITTV
jgi:hypothetical protein